MENGGEFNYLKDEKSIYLKQHNQNPVKWYPYGPIALQKAQDENKPIFLSIGYSSCHWCHVMEEESFSEKDCAKILNDNYICIKVDREELPDLDSYFQLACQVMNGRGGWPLSAFLTSDFKPFFIGTYFPTIAKDGIPSFKELIKNMAKSYTEDFETIKTNSDQIVEALKSPPKVENKIEFEGHYPQASSILNALKNYEDQEYGGYGVEPKFPHLSFFEWAIEHMLEGMVEEEQGKHIILSIEKMLMGGIYDQARGGLHRYSVDQSWTVPHFEKMLYDQAGLLKLLTKAALIYPSPLLYDAILQTIDYIRSEMLSDEQYFFAGQDSDSEGIEGLFFGFSKDEFLDAIKDFDENLLEKTDDILKWFQITEDGNFQRGLNVITLNPKLKEDFYKPENWNIVRGVRQALLSARKMRIPPVTDNKGIASWNFQMLTALIDVIQYSKVEAIRHNAQTLLKNCHQKINEQFLFLDEKEITHIHTTTTRGEHVPLFEDYVMFAEYSFRSFELTGDKNFLTNGERTLQFIMKNFTKDNFVYTRSIEFDDTEKYENIHTPIFDQSHKSAFATFLILLKKWSLHFDDFKEYLQKLEKSLEVLTHLSLQNPLAFGETLRALVYPDEAYRKIEIPKAWYDENKIQSFFLNFSVRFTLVAHERDTESWQICNIKECELKGVGFEEFKKVFIPEQNQ